MSYRVKAGDYSVAMGKETGTVEEILGNVAAVLGTQKGSVPLYREFGISAEILDRPVQVARAMLAAQVAEAVEELEPRVTVKRVTTEVDGADPSRVIPTVEVEIKNE